MLCHRQAMPSISSYSANPACHSATKNPALSHSRNRLWMALALPKRSLGSAFHWQPVRNTYTMASNTTRASLGLRPPPGLRANFRRVGRPGRCGINGSTRSQNASDTTHDSSLAFAIAFLRPAHRRGRKNSVLHYLRISSKGAIHHVLAFNGGIAPIARRRGPVALMLDEREEISRGIAGGESIRRIAASLGRSPSTVSREVARHGGRRSYRATEADARAWELALRPKPCRLASHPELRWRVAEKLALDWSPEQVAGWLKREFPADKGLLVSHETIYRSLFVQARGVLKKELLGHLRAG